MREHSIFPANGSAVELNNCLEEAQITCARLNTDASHRINVALSLGKFLVVATIPYFCRSTDALAGTHKQLVSCHDTRAEADAAVVACYGDGNCDESYAVLPELPPVQYVDVCAGPCGEDLPF